MDNDKNSFSDDGKIDSNRNIFDRIGDKFEVMLKGILIFAFIKLPKNIWRVIVDIERLKKLFKYLYSVIRAIVLCFIWIVVVLLGWWMFLRERFIEFWRSVIAVIVSGVHLAFNFVMSNIGWIWMIIALCGSVYGLLYVTRNKWRKKKKPQNEQDDDSSALENTSFSNEEKK